GRRAVAADGGVQGILRDPLAALAGRARWHREAAHTAARAARRRVAAVLSRREDDLFRPLEAGPRVALRAPRRPGRRPAALARLLARVLRGQRVAVRGHALSSSSASRVTSSA